jgi:4-hydroxythreonine-4-phosphate dehydrogenase
MGDPAGVGPELCLRLLNRAAIGEVSYIPVVIGNRAILERVSRATGLPFSARIQQLTSEGLSSGLDLAGPMVLDLDIPGLERTVPGQVQAACGLAAGEFIRIAVEGTAQSIADAMLTAPLNKEALNLGGFPFPGHTEMLASLTGRQGREAMLLYSEEIAVTFATLHTALSRVPKTLHTETVVQVGKLAAETVGLLRGRDAKVGVLALNPHAGEAGLFGDEEERVILPAIERLRAEGIEVEGPLVPDAAFVPRTRERFDVFVTLYHDQGSIPFKMLAFEEGVNLTMGLPIVRTSPDHGTAFDIAWKGTASPASFFAAADLAIRLATARAS